MMKHVKIINAYSCEELENKINDFIESENLDINLLDFVYQVKTVLTKNGSSSNLIRLHYCMIINKKGPLEEDYEDYSDVEI